MQEDRDVPPRRPCCCIQSEEKRPPMTRYVAPTIDQVLAKLKYMSPEQLEMVRQAYELAERLHRGQKRSSGDDYITHPLAVADILADLHADAETIAAGLLHDVVEDCDYPPERIKEQFGLKVMKFVMGVTKLSKQTAKELEPTDAHGKPDINGNGANFIGRGYGIVSWTSKIPEKENNVK